MEFLLNLNKFGLFLIIAGIVIPFHAGSAFTFCSKKNLHEVRLFRKNLLERNKAINSRYEKAKYIYMELWINGICLTVLAAGIVLICFF